MHVTFTAEELAFRDEVRSFFENDIPQDIHDKQAQNVELEPEDQIRFQKALRQGLGGTELAGGTRWNGLESRTETYI